MFCQFTVCFKTNVLRDFSSSLDLWFICLGIRLISIEIEKIEIEKKLKIEKLRIN